MLPLDLRQKRIIIFDTLNDRSIYEQNFEIIEIDLVTLRTYIHLTDIQHLQ